MHSLHQTPGMHLIHCITITSQANNETEKFEDNLCLVNDSKQRDNEAASCLSSGSFTPFWSSLPFLRWSQSNEAASCLSSRSFTPFCQSSPLLSCPFRLRCKASGFFTYLKNYFGIDNLIINNYKLKEFVCTSECYFIIMVTLFAFLFFPWISLN